MFDINKNIEINPYHQNTKDVRHVILLFFLGSVFKKFENA